MKAILTLCLLTLGVIHNGLTQINVAYSLTRPIGGGDISLVEFNLSLGTETLIKTYLPSELNDYNPEATAFDNQNNYFITFGKFAGGDSLIAIDVTNGNIVHYFKSSTYEIISIEQNGTNSYTLTRPIGGGNLSLIEFNLALGTETLIKTYLPSELNDYIPSFTSFDNQNNYFITINSDSLVAIDVTNGDIIHSLKSSTYEIFTVEQKGAKSYSITRPIGGGNLSLIEFNLSLGTETLIKTYLPSELNDYNGNFTTFDNQNNYFVTLGRFAGGDSLIAIDVITGNIDFKYSSLSQEVFSIEIGNSQPSIISHIALPKNEFVVYPNPCQDHFKFDNQILFNRLEIYDSNGKIVCKTNESNSVIDVSNLPTGIYIVRIMNDLGQSQLSRFIKI